MTNDNGSIRVWWLSKLFVKQSCDMDFANFPFDTQHCSFFISSSYADKVLRFEGDLVSDKLRFHYFKEFSVELEFVSSNFTFAPFESGMIKQDYSFVGYNITLRRKSRSFMLNYYLVCLGMNGLAAISFWIPASAIPGRISLLVTISLSLTGIFTSVQVKSNNRNLMQSFNNPIPVPDFGTKNWQYHCSWCLCSGFLEFCSYGSYGICLNHGPMEGQGDQKLQNHKMQ